jgi:hypothetical protein
MSPPECRQHGAMQKAEEGVMRGVLTTYWRCPSVTRSGLPCAAEVRTAEPITDHAQPDLFGGIA